jgi:hypothetical protein
VVFVAFDVILGQGGRSGRQQQKKKQNSKAGHGVGFQNGSSEGLMFLTTGGLGAGSLLFFVQLMDSGLV